MVIKLTTLMSAGRDADPQINETGVLDLWIWGHLYHHTMQYRHFYTALLDFWIAA